MPQYHETYRALILGVTISGLYFSPVEKIIENKWIIRLLKCFPIVPLTIFPLHCLFEAKYLLYDEGTLLQKIYALTLTCFFLLSTFVVFSFYNNRQEYWNLFEMWETLFADDFFPDKREEKLKKRMLFMNRWLVIFLPISVICGSMYSVLTYFNENKDLGHPSGFPYRHQSPDFEIMTTFELITGITGFMTLIAFDSVMVTLLSLEEIQLLHLKEILARIIDDDELKFGITQKVNSRHRHRENFAEFEAKIRIWITHHQKILRFHDDMQRIFGPSLSFKNILFVLVLCLICFLTASRSVVAKDVGTGMVYITTNYILHYMNIKFADSITEANQTIFDDAFGKNWHRFPSNIVSSFQIILLRSQKTVQFMTLKIYPFNSKNFLRILYSAYTIFTFLLQIVEVQVMVPEEIVVS